MTPEPNGVELSVCSSCQTRYLPTDGPCPRCGSDQFSPYHDPGLGTVLSSTELVHPAAGWESPHRLALVELPQSVRLLAVVDGSLPSAGSLVAVSRDGELYRARPEPVSPKRSERGEGESPRVGRPDASFEPPR